MSSKFDLVKQYYNDQLWSEARVRMAVIKFWITEEEFKLITDIDY